MTTPHFPIAIDGVLHAADAAQLRAGDAGFTHGLAVFDTLLCAARTPERLAAHMQRLVLACRAIDITETDAAVLARSVTEYAAHLPLEPVAVRTTVSRGASGKGPTVVITARKFERAPAEGVTLVVERRFALAGDALDSIKTTNRARHVLATEAARAAGAFDAVLVHAEGDAVCAANANVWAVVDGRLTTPPTSRGALEGIVRGVLLAHADLRIRTAPLSLADLQQASEIFLTNSLHQVVPVRALLGVVAGLPGPQGEWTARARAALAAAPR